MIIRTPKNRDNPYAQINKFLLGNPELSWQAKGLLAYLLTLPDDWKVYPRELVKHAKNGRDALYRILRELIDRGYLLRTQQRNEDNQFRQVTYTVLEYPSLVNSVISNRPKIPYTGNWDTGENSGFAGDPGNIFARAEFERGERGNYNDPEAIDGER